MSATRWRTAEKKRHKKIQQVNTRSVGANVKAADVENPFDVLVEEVSADWTTVDEEVDRVTPENSLADNASVDEDSESLIYGEDFTPECQYCGIQDPNYIVMCNVCKKWFCNGFKKKSCGSHVVTHLAQAGHNEVMLHKDGPVFETVLQCSVCRCRNVFVLGFVLDFQDNAETVAVLLCRQRCSAQRSNNNKKNKWKPIIDELAFQQWLVYVPPKDVQLCSRNIPLEQIFALEEMWKNDVDVTIDDLQASAFTIIHQKPKSLPLRFKNGYEYCNAFLPLVALEENYDEIQSKSQIQDKTEVHWHPGADKHIFVAHFKLHKPLGEIRLLHNTKLRITYTGEKKKSWSRVGFITKIPNFGNEEYAVEFRMPTEETVCKRDFTVENVFNGVSYERMRTALELIADDELTIARSIYRSLLGHPPQLCMLDCQLPMHYSAPNLDKLNRWQKRAVKHALRRPLSLIQGPPGTGKTVTSATIVYHLSKQNNGTILVCAPSNVAVDNLTSKIHQTGLKVVRLYAKSREDTDSPVAFLGLHNQICQMEGWDNEAELVKLNRLKEKMGELSPAEESRFNQLKRPYEKKLLKATDVVCCTCVGAGDRRLMGCEFPSVLIDECTQATEPECIIPLLLGTQQVILVGDHCQLGPVVLCRKAADAGLKRSLFERLLKLGVDLYRLEVQYRMHPELSKFPSTLFYQGVLKDGVDSETHKMSELEKLWPQPNLPMLFQVAAGPEELAASGTSYLNRTEAEVVERFVCKILKCGVKPGQIGIITPYDGQRAYLSEHMYTHGLLSAKQCQEIEVASVDVFQGREKDVIIFSCVRSNDRHDIGFLRDPRRLNVALTRARYGIIIVGNPQNLSTNRLWNRLLTYYRQHKALVEGSPDNNRESEQKSRKKSKSKKNKKALQSVVRAERVER